MVVALLGVAFSLVGSVTATGRRPGAVGVPRVTVTFEDGTQHSTQALTSVRGAAPMADFPGTPVRVGGEGRSMVVLFPRGLFGNGPYAVPVKSIEPEAGARPAIRSTNASRP
ncbi:MAG: hypothetical protein QOI78_6648 [Actinomycetota bacterium]|nr:hypothetical protein [Actinomycetota bacterium]